jgi:tetratricopeptide (TPR) repeat protein
VSIADALLNKGNKLGELRRTEEAIAAYDDLIARFSKATEPELRDRVVWALNNRSGLLGEPGSRDKGLAILEDLTARFEASTEPEAHEAVAKLLIAKGLVLEKVDRREALRVYDELLARFEGTGVQLGSGLDCCIAAETLQTLHVF